MNTSASRPVTPARLAYPYRDEIEVARTLAAGLAAHLDWGAVVATATPWVEAVRRHPPPFWAMESLLREYPITGAEGLALMRLAEALLRVPDVETAVALTADQLGRADFDGAAQDAAAPPGAHARRGPHHRLAQLSASAIAMSKKFLPDADEPPGLLGRLGARTVVAATVRAIQLLGRQFVLGRHIDEAMDEAAAQRRSQPALRYSFDMLGEGARTEAQAQRYLGAYRQAIDRIAAARPAGSPEAGDGISVKLSALFPRFEEAQRERVFAELLPRVALLLDAAAAADLNLTIDAEESDRLELSLDVFEAAADHVARRHPRWSGLGLAVQAYQTRALDALDAVTRIGRARGLRFMVRLVKGAYWDGEVKRAQELGLHGYPVFTHKHHTDTSYLACAEFMLEQSGVLYPQFATHNAATIAAILQMARAHGTAAFEFQRLHGMGEGVYREAMKGHALGLRVYAPVGEHRDLLAYLVRRLLENGANSSFVHLLSDDSVAPADLLASPTRAEAQPALPLPVAMYGAERANSRGIDLACAAERAPLEAALAGVRVEPITQASAADVALAMQRLAAGFPTWNARPVAERAAVLRRAADALEAQAPAFCAWLVAEAGKTLGDSVAEVREAVDFCRYYAAQAQACMAPLVLPGPTGESNTLHLRGRGVFVCISPWNFPLAIFVGQVAAALVSGNAVAAKPAEQTPHVAARMVELLHRTGVPQEALALLHGPGETVGAALVAHPHTGGVCFTGSTAVARAIHRALATKDGAIVPLIAETGGINAMVVDSTALPEQVVDAVVQSAFRSAGQRCSALRLLCVHAAIADTVIEMIAGALAELRVDDPALLCTDVGPLIDDEAFAAVARHVERLEREAVKVGQAVLASAHPRLLAPVAFEIARVADLKQEIFGPVLHVVRYDGDVEQVIDDINALGYGLTLGLQTRIDSRALRLAVHARVGNVYVNRNMIGAVVGVQPFGGEGLSGTGPKAGGPYYLYRFCSEQTVTINTAAAGGNAELLAGPVARADRAAG